MEMSGLITVLSAVVLMLLLWGFFARSYLMEAKKRLTEQWQAIVAGLNKRHDLMPNLVETVRMYTNNQEEILAELIAVRQRTMRLPRLDAEKIEWEHKLSQLVNRLIDFGRTMQDLSMDTNFLELRKETADLEESIASHTEHYNEMVRAYNELIVKTWMKPWSKMLGYKPKNIFEMEK